MTQKRDYYDVLEVDKSAGPDELKKAYRRLAMKFHPDQNPDDSGAESKFKELTEAYQVLSTPESKNKYDKYGHSAPAGGSGFGGGGDFDMDMGSMTDFFESMFGTMFSGGRRGPQRGSDLQYNISITLEQVVTGSEFKITIPRGVKCEQCNGTGAKNGTAKKMCSICKGQGQVRLQQGIFVMNSPCPTCSGKGSVITAVCDVCEDGIVEEDNEIELAIAPGVRDGQTIVVPDAGDWGRDGIPPGDLHVMIGVEKHKIFERQGDDLLCVQTITYPQAVLGDTVEVPTIDNNVNMKIKSGTKAGRVYQLRGKGIPYLHGGGRGVQKVKIDIDIPTRLDDEQKEIVLQLGKKLGTDVQTHHPSIMDKFKSFFE